MRLPNIFKKIKESSDLPKDIFILCIIFLVGIGAFLLGQFSAFEKQRGGELRITEVPTKTTTTESGGGVSSHAQLQDNSTTQATTVSGMYVGSRSGSTYHLPWCPGAKQIREENKIWFQTKEEAVARGYKPATNCKGI